MIKKLGSKAMKGRIFAMFSLDTLAKKFREDNLKPKIEGLMKLQREEESRNIAAEGTNPADKKNLKD